MKLSIETSSFNQRRRSSPWIALVDFTSNSKGEFKWGDWIGDKRNGSAGLLEIDAEAGDIIARGQKDYRNAHNSSPDWFILMPDGNLKALATKVEALQLSRMPLAQRIGAPETVAVDQ